MGIRSETEPGQELPGQKSSHEPRGLQPSHEPTADGSEKKSSKILGDSPSSAFSGTSYQFIGDLFDARSGEALFVDGSWYRGTWDSLGMAGAGSYRMPHDVIYDGEMRDGMQHGQGSLEYPGKGRIDGVWNRGELKKWKYTFADGLVFETENWTYCNFPDRRFTQSKINGLNPAGRSLKTQDQPTKVIPTGCYDSGDGVFDPSTLCVTNFDNPSKIIRIPSAKEIEWITTRCRKGGAEPTGYQPWLNENWSSDPPELPYRLPMSSDSPERWWKRIFTFEKDPNAFLDGMRRSLEKGEDYSSSDWDGRSRGHSVCVCKSEGLKPETTPEPEPEFEFDVCWDLDVCGDRDSEELSSIEIDALREVVCEKMTNSDQEWEDGDDDDLLMTVCCPPKDTIMIRTRRRSTKTLDAPEGYRRREDYWDGKECEECFDFDGFHHGRIFRDESARGEDDFGPFFNKFGKDLKPSEVVKKRRLGRGKRTKTTIKLGAKKQKKRPCPVHVDTKQLLQRKVGDLLFSPALEAPRSPVYLVRKDCDKKTCRKLKPKKYNASKCGVSLSPASFPAKKRTPRVCKEDKKLKEELRSENKKICSPPGPFITIRNKFSKD